MIAKYLYELVEFTVIVCCCVSVEGVNVPNVALETTLFQFIPSTDPHISAFLKHEYNPWLPFADSGLP